MRRAKTKKSATTTGPATEEWRVEFVVSQEPLENFDLEAWFADLLVAKFFAKQTEADSAVQEDKDSHAA